MATIEHVPFHADPILAAIDRHNEAWSVFQVAVEGNPAEAAEIALDEALTALLGTPCATRFGGLALLRHLKWWLDEEAEFAEHHQPGYYAAAQARASGLTLFIGSELPPVPFPDPMLIGPLASRVVRRLASRYSAPAFGLRPLDEDAPGSIEPWQAVTLGRAGSAHVRALRVLDVAGDVLASLVLIVGGMAAIGLASLS